MSNSDSNGGGAVIGSAPTQPSTVRRRWPLALLLGLAVAGAVAVVVFSSRDHTNTSLSKPPGTPMGPHGVWNGLKAKAASGTAAGELAAERSAFTILRGKDERLPPRMKSHIRKTLGAPRGSFAFEETQHATSSQGGVWIVSGEKVVCLVEAARGSLACDPAPAFIEDGLVLGVAGPPDSFGHPHRFVVFGVAPDWAERARLRVGNTVRPVPIQANVYAYRAHAPILLSGLER